MTLKDIVSLAKTVREFDANTLNVLDSVLADTADNAQRNELERVAVWLRHIEELSGNDDELADDVGGALTYVRVVLSPKEARDEHES